MKYYDIIIKFQMVSAISKAKQGKMIIRVKVATTFDWISQRALMRKWHLSKGLETRRRQP